MNVQIAEVRFTYKMWIGLFVLSKNDSQFTGIKHYTINVHKKQNLILLIYAILTKILFVL